MPVVDKLKRKKLVFIGLVIFLIGLFILIINGHLRDYLSGGNSSDMPMTMGDFVIDVPKDLDVGLFYIYPGPQYPIWIKEVKLSPPIFLNGRLKRAQAIKEEKKLMSFSKDGPLVAESLNDYFGMKATLLTRYRDSSIFYLSTNQWPSVSSRHSLFLWSSDYLLQITTHYDLTDGLSPVPDEKIIELKKEKTEDFLKWSRRFTDRYQWGKTSIPNKKMFKTGFSYIRLEDQEVEPDFVMGLRKDLAGNKMVIVNIGSFKAGGQHPLLEAVFKPLKSPKTPPGQKIIFNLTRQREVGGRQGLEIITFEDGSSRSPTVAWAETNLGAKARPYLKADMRLNSEAGYDNRALLAHWNSVLAGVKPAPSKD